MATRVVENSPAEAAGMIDGDIILEIDNVETLKIEDLVREIHKHKVGETVRIYGFRNRREHFFETKLSEAP